MNTNQVELSLVIPVYNGSQTICAVVDSIHEVFASLARRSPPELEVVLVNDGSADDSDLVCTQLVNRFNGTVVFVNLARNFGEHSAVLAGLAEARGRYVGVLDDDGQNPPAELLRMWEHLQASDLDVVYGLYREKKHHWFRNLGSRFNDRMATLMLRKPADIYLSSFKVMSRFVVDQIIQYRGPYPYVDGLIFRTTRRIGQIEVQHEERQAGASGYNLRRLVRLWLNMFLGFSVTPLRISVILGLLTSALSVLLMAGIVIDKLWLNPSVPVGIPTILALITMFSGIQLVVLGMIGEYVGRLFMDQNGMPQSIVRSVIRSPAATSCESACCSSMQTRPESVIVAHDRHKESDDITLELHAGSAGVSE
ncbi:MAG: glycosyltransferase family 2 protein [Planctomycetaceae bacterium]|nr:glycosyltransferase family 2 protein [Planctomycetaceae bacterium]